MKFAALTFAFVGIVAAFVRSDQPTQPQILLLTGDTNGNLAPCGCTKPMTGGIKRRIQAIKQFTVPEHTTLLDNGNLIAGIGRQDQIKAQTIAEILGAAKYDAINIGPNDAKLGLGFLLSMNSLANNAFVASEIPSAQQNNFQRFVVTGPFLVIGLAAHPSQITQPIGAYTITTDDAIKEGTELAQQGGLATVLLLQGNRSEAELIAKQHPQLKLIEYSSVGSPMEQMEKVGNTVLVSPGSDGKYVLKLSYASGSFYGYMPIDLGPQVKDDTTTTRLYRNYLERIDEAHLLENLPRRATPAFSGSSMCGTCHQKAVHVWQHSMHPHALQTLAKQGHDRDPECLPCHVVGLNSTKGFRSQKLTPQLAGVGCESCHGPGVLHSRSPKLNRLPKVHENTCTSCHTANTSPNFSFDKFWKKIKH